MIGKLINSTFRLRSRKDDDLFLEFIPNVHKYMFGHKDHCKEKKHPSFRSHAFADLPSQVLHVRKWEKPR